MNLHTVMLEINLNIDCKFVGLLWDDPYDLMAFKSWAATGMCLAIPVGLGLYKKLVETAFRVFLVTGRDGDTQEPETAENLFMQGFIGLDKLIMRCLLHCVSFIYLFYHYFRIIYQLVF